MSTTRLEAFSDGVLAVAITLLVLNLHVPAYKPGINLGHELARQWPQYAAYVTSFLTIGIIWLNHHAMIRRLASTDHGIMTWNLLLLMSVALLPFATALMAEYLKHPRGQHLAAAMYSGAYLLMSLMFAGTNRHILFTKAHLLAVDLPEAERRKLLTRGVLGLVPYALATALAPVSAYVTLAICGAVAVFYALPFASGTPARVTQ